MPTQYSMRVYCLCIVCVVATMTVSCSKEPNGNDKEVVPELRQSTEKAESEVSPTPGLDSEKGRGEGQREEERESKSEPPTDQIGEDCVAFVRSTKTVESGENSAECPQCPAGQEVLRFDS